MLLKKLRDTLFLSPVSPIAKSRLNNYLIVLWIIIGLHVLGLIFAILFTCYLNEYTGLNDFLITISNYLNYTAFFSGLFLFVLSLKSEVLVSQTYEFASSTAQASSHQFETFKSHLEWLNEFISPTKFEDSSTNLVISISTPLYGIGVGPEEAEQFISFLESWVENYEKIDKIPSERPTFELAVWEKQENTTTFTNYYSEEVNHQKLQLIDKYANLLTRLIKLRRKGFINFHLYFTDRSDARLFMARSLGKQRCAGLFAIFTPLIKSSAVKVDGWTLTGFSFWEEKSYQNVYQYNYKLTNSDAKNEREDKYDFIKNNPKDWLLDHYNLKK